MLGRIAVALFALYLVHGADNVARDAAGIATTIGPGAADRAVAACLDRPSLCREVAGRAGIALPDPRLVAAHDVRPAAIARAEPAYPLPPVRRIALGRRDEGG